MKRKTPDEQGMAPIKARGRVFWVSNHAAQRALEMGVSLKLFPSILEQGAWHDAPPRSKYAKAGGRICTTGKVSLGVTPTLYGEVITTCLWATVEGWANAPEAKGRKFRGRDRTERALAAWLGAEVEEYA